MYNNLGVILCQKNNLEKGGEFFITALDNIDQQLEYKQFSVLTNLLIISMYTQNGTLLKKIQNRCDGISSEELLRYRKSLRPGAFKEGMTESFSFFGFSGLSYIF